MQNNRRHGNNKTDGAQESAGRAIAHSTQLIRGVRFEDPSTGRSTSNAFVEGPWLGPPCLNNGSSFGASCLDVRTLTFCQRMGFRRGAESNRARVNWNSAAFLREHGAPVQRVQAFPASPGIAGAKRCDRRACALRLSEPNFSRFGGVKTSDQSEPFDLTFRFSCVGSHGFSHDPKVKGEFFLPNS